MEESNLVKGIFLVVAGAVVIYMSIALRLIDLILILGVILLVMGIFYLFLALVILFYDGSLASTARNISDFMDSKSKKGSTLKSNMRPHINSGSFGSRNSSFASNIRNSNFGLNIKNSVLNSSGLNDGEYSGVLRAYGGRNMGKKSSASFFGPSRNNGSHRNDGSGHSYLVDNVSSNNYRKEKHSSIFTNFKSNDPKINPKAVLRTRQEYNDSFANLSDYDEHQKSFEKSDYVDYIEYQQGSDGFCPASDLNNDYNQNHDFFEDESYGNNSVPELRDLNFTPNYEKPMRITRKPRRKSLDKIDVHNVPKRSSDGSRLVLNDGTYLEFEKHHAKPIPHRKTYVELANEVIVPVHDDYDDYIVPEYENNSLVDVYDGFESVNDDLDYGGESGIVDDLPYDKEFVIDDLDDDLDDDVSVIAPIAPITNKDLPQSKLKDSNESTIKVDPNNPESLPIPSLLNSYVICENKGILTSKDAFEEVATHAKSEILLEAPDIREMGKVFLLALSKVKSRVIIPELDTSDLSYVLLISSLVKSGVQVKTLPSVDSFNLIGDLSHALIISNSVEDDFEYGAVYDDEESVKGIKELFESSWAIAEELDLN